MARDDIRLINPDGTMSATQTVDLKIPDGTRVRAKYPGRLYDTDTFYPAQILRSQYNVRHAMRVVQM